MQKRFHIIENLMQRIKDLTEDGFTVVYFVLWSDRSKYTPFSHYGQILSQLKYNLSSI